MKKTLVFVMLIALSAASCTKSSLYPSGSPSSNSIDDNPHNSNGNGDDNGNHNGADDNPNNSNGNGDDNP